MDFAVLRTSDTVYPHERMNKRNNESANSKPDLPPHIHVRTRADWQACLSLLTQQPRLAIDLEANSMYAYQEEICLIQISIPDQDYIVDPLGDFSLEGLGELVHDPEVEKIFHAAEYDLILMKRQYGWELENLFDTMWAARILGVERVGLANILGDLYQLNLDKKYQRANWCRRPLSRAQLAYAQADTHYLLSLRDYFAEKLEAAGRMEEAQEIFAEQTEIELSDNSFDVDGFWSIHGVHKLPTSGKTILKALTIYRDREAQRRDKPHFKIFHDKTLLQLARQQPRSWQELGRVRGMSEGQIRRYGHDLVRLIKDNKELPPPPRPPRRQRPPHEVMDRYERLHTWRKERGRERGVESDVIISRDTLWALARANPRNKAELEQIKGVGPWRLKTYADEILDVLGH